MAVGIFETITASAPAMFDVKSVVEHRPPSPVGPLSEEEDEEDDTLPELRKREATGNESEVYLAKRTKTNTAERRASHNAIERARRENLNGRFLELAHALPTMQNVKRPSKSMIVNKSIDWVYESQIREATLVRENQALREALNELQSRTRGAEGTPVPAQQPVQQNATPANRPLVPLPTTRHHTQIAASPHQGHQRNCVDAPRLAAPAQNDQNRPSNHRSMSIGSDFSATSSFPFVGVFDPTAAFDEMFPAPATVHSDDTSNGGSSPPLTSWQSARTPSTASESSQLSNSFSAPSAAESLSAFLSYPQGALAHEVFGAYNNSTSPTPRTTSSNGWLGLSSFDPHHI